MPRLIHRAGRVLLKLPFLPYPEWVASRFHRYWRPYEEEMEIRLDDQNRMVINLLDYVGFLIYLRGFYEIQIVRQLKHHLRPGMTFFDIGAHFGQHTVVGAAAVGPSGSVHAFEPGQRQFEYLERNVWLNSYENVHLNRMALGESVGVIGFVQGPAANLGASHVAGDEAPTEEVPVNTLDAYCRERGVTSVDLIKIDVEGAELQVFRGAGQVFERAPPRVILYECIDSLCARFGHSARETHGMLLAHGYRIHAVRGRDLVRVDLAKSAHITDFVALHD